MNARKCDRCGEFYAYYKGKSYMRENVNTVSLKSDRGSFGYISVDLCPACMDKQIRFLRGVELKNGPDANQLKAEAEK